MACSRRQFLALSGGLAATATLSACGSNTGRPAATPAATGSGSAARPTLLQWYHKYGEEGVQQAVTTWAAEYPDAAVRVNWYLGDYDKALPAALLTPSAPDVFELGNGPTLDMIKAGQVTDLTELVGAAADFSPPVIKRLTYQDKLWAIPQTIDMQLLYYRKSLLSKAGVQPPTTLDALVVAAKAVTTADMGGFFAGNDGGLGVLGSILIWSSGLDQLNENRTAAGFDDPAFHATVVKYRELFNSGALVKSAAADWFDASPFINGETALQWGGLWDLPKVSAALGDDVGVLPFPAAGASGRPVVPFGAFSAIVNAKSKNVDAAKAYVKWLWVDQEDKQVQFSNGFGTHIPAKPKLVGKADKVSTGLGAQAATFVNENGFTSDLFWTSATNEAFNAALSNVVKKNADVAQEFNRAATTTAGELKRVNG